MFLDHLLNFFHRKAKTRQPQEASAIEESVSETRSMSHVSTTREEEAVTPPPAVLPQLEFDESRNLLQLDFFGTNDKEQPSLASFPKFDYLLQPAKEIDNTEKKPRKSSTTLRHRISLYRPSTKTVKRSLSSPDIYNQQ